MKIIYLTIIAISLLALNIQSAAADEAVMVIRFNQELVDYQKPLEKVVKSALDAKPSVFFDVVSIIPETESKKNNKRIKKHSSFLTNQLIENMQMSGVTSNNIRVTFQNSRVINSSEVHIFVR